MQIMGANDFLARTAMNNQSSLINAVVNVAAIGISLNPAEKEAYLVPRNGAVCLDISMLGLMRLAEPRYRSNRMGWVQSDIVYEKDHFRMVGLDKQPSTTLTRLIKPR